VESIPQFSTKTLTLLAFCCLQLHMVFFREKYQSYKKALNKFQDGLAVIAIYLEVSNLIDQYTIL